jgi:hypothetical protein
MTISTFVGRGLFGIGIAGLISKWLLSAYFMGHRPAKQETGVGLTFAFNQHGGIVYLTHFESELVSILFWGSILLIGIGASLIINSRASGSKSQRSQK